jgi:hypothetical protein
MNALELANELEKDINWIQDGLARKWIVDMLRKQQIEIEVLKAQILAWENAEVPVEVMADIIVELEKRGFIEKVQ